MAKKNKQILFGAVIIAAVALVAFYMAPKGFFTVGVYQGNVRDFSYTIQTTTQSRCQTPANGYLGVYNPDNIELVSASVKGQIVGVDQSNNQIHVGEIRDLGAPRLSKSTSCEVYDRSCDRSMLMDVFIMPGEVSIDGTCSWQWTINYKSPAPIVPPTGQVTVQENQTQPIVYPTYNNQTQPTIPTTTTTPTAPKQDLTIWIIVAAIIVLLAAVVIWVYRR